MPSSKGQQLDAARTASLVASLLAPLAKRNLETFASSRSVDGEKTNKSRNVVLMILNGLAIESRKVA